MDFIICVTTLCLVLFFTKAEPIPAPHRHSTERTVATTLYYNFQYQPLVWKFRQPGHYGYRYEEKNGIYRGLQYHPRTWAKLSKLIPIVTHNKERYDPENSDKTPDGFAIDKRRKLYFVVALRKKPLVNRLPNHLEVVFDSDQGPEEEKFETHAFIPNPRPLMQLLCHGGRQRRCLICPIPSRKKPP